MSAQGELPQGLTGRHERPFLYSWNRRLRHLHGVSLRNLDTSASPSRLQGRTITDDDAPYNLDSPAKRALRSHASSLSHSASFSNLTTASKDVPLTPKKSTTVYQQDGKSSLRPGGSRLRRRSTLHWSTASPRARQQKLEDLSAHRLADVWFSVHLKNMDEPLYISEVVERSMNPNFASFDVDATVPRIGRSEHCTLRVWTKDDRHDAYSLLLELKVNFRSLQYIGKHIEDFHHPLPQNCVLLHLSDGVYTSFTDLPATNSGLRYQQDAKAAHTEPSSSFDALMQLANLDECVHDAFNARQQLEQDVNAWLSQRQGQQTRKQLLTERKEDLAATRSATVALSRQKSLAEKRKVELKKSLQLRRESVRASTNPDERRQFSKNSQSTIKNLTEQIRTASEQAQGQIRRIGEDLLTVFPIEAIRNKALHFSIRNIYLPNSTFDDTNRDEIAAALGFTAHLVHLLSLYLSTPLPYPIDATAASPSIQDPISMAIAQRQYPLYPTNVAYKFEYGVFLLNKDIEFLMCKAGLRVLDIRHSLPNLKYLLYVLTAGSRELPARKAGGVRGLLGGRLTPSVSRRGSEESVRGHRDYLKRGSGDARANGNLPLQMPKEKVADSEDPFTISPTTLALPHGQRVSLHTGQ